MGRSASKGKLDRGHFLPRSVQFVNHSSLYGVWVSEDVTQTMNCATNNYTRYICAFDPRIKTMQMLQYSTALQYCSVAVLRYSTAPSQCCATVLLRRSVVLQYCSVEVLCYSTAPSQCCATVLLCRSAVLQYNYTSAFPQILFQRGNPKINFHIPSNHCICKHHL